MVDGVSGVLGFVIRKLEKRRESDSVATLFHAMEGLSVLVILMIQMSV